MTFQATFMRGEPQCRLLTGTQKGALTLGTCNACKHSVPKCSTHRIRFTRPRELRAHKAATRAFPFRAWSVTTSTLTQKSTTMFCVRELLITWLWHANFGKTPWLSQSDLICSNFYKAYASGQQASSKVYFSASLSFASPVRELYLWFSALPT